MLNVMGSLRLPSNINEPPGIFIAGKNRYDGSWDSLRDRSRRPHSHPNQHTPEEIKLIRDMRRRNPHAGLVVSGSNSCSADINVPFPGLYRFLKKQGIMAEKLPNPKVHPQAL